MSKVQTALEIIAGIQDGWHFWDDFFEQEKPRRFAGEGMLQYRSRVASVVKAEACAFLARHLENGEL